MQEMVFNADGVRLDVRVLVHRRFLLGLSRPRHPLLIHLGDVPVPGQPEADSPHHLLLGEAMQNGICRRRRRPVIERRGLLGFTFNLKHILSFFVLKKEITFNNLL